MIKTLKLQNFRNYSAKTFDFSSRATLIVGPNAVGKTNILEAIYLLATGKSFRADKEIEVIRESEIGGAGENVARVVGTVDGIKEVGSEIKDGNTGAGGEELEIVFDNRPAATEASVYTRASADKLARQGRFHKLYKINGVGKRQIDFAGNLKAVLFQPVDLEIVLGSPSIRRHYLDNVLSQAHREYRLAHHLYEKALKQRNRLLWRAKKEGRAVSRQQLDYWDRLLIGNGEVVHRYRRQYIDFVNLDRDNFFALELFYDHSVISEARLQKYRLEEQISGTTLVGPHRDEVVIKFKSKTKFKFTRELATFGSRGEQRLGVFTLKLAEVAYVDAQTGQRPLLLLDDIFSELDESNRHHVLEFIPRQQTIMTTTDIHRQEESFLAKLDVKEIRL